MSSFQSGSVDYFLNKRHLPSAQVERVPNVEELEDEDLELEVGGSVSSFRAANFLPPGMKMDVAFSPSSIGVVSQSPLFSPVYTQLGRVNPERLADASLESQALRRKLLRGSNVLIVQGGYSGKSFIYEKLKELGVFVYIMDGPDSFWKVAAEEGLLSGFLEIDFSDSATVFERAADIIVGMDVKFDCVTTYYEDAVPLATRLASALGFDLNPVEACDLARNKRKTREALKKAGLPSPAFFSITSPADVDAACDEVGFPAVLKPAVRIILWKQAPPSLTRAQWHHNWSYCRTNNTVIFMSMRKAETIEAFNDHYDGILRALNGSRSKHVPLAFFYCLPSEKFGAASLGVFKVYDREQVHKMYAEVMETMKPEYDPIWVQGTEIILEEFYDGDEFDVDVLLFDGKCVYAKLADNWKCWEPWFQETGLNMPSYFPEAGTKELISLAVNSTVALGFKYGAFHVEVKWTSRGPRLIEVNARMGGIAVRDSNLAAWGVDLVEEHCMAMLKIPIKPMVPETYREVFMSFGLIVPYDGVVNSDDWLEHLRGDKRVRKISYEKKLGDAVKGPKETLPDWLAELRVVFAAKEDMQVFLKDVISSIAVPITPNNPEDICPFFLPLDSFPFAPSTYEENSKKGA